MSEAVLVALITGGISLLGSVITIAITSQNQQAELDKKIAVMDAKMDDMREDIKTHNQYAKMFSENIPAIRQHMTDVDRRLDNIERRTA